MFPLYVICSWVEIASSQEVTQDFSMSWNGFIIEGAPKLEVTMFFSDSQWMHGLLKNTIFAPAGISIVTLRTDTPRVALIKLQLCQYFCQAL